MLIHTLPPIEYDAVMQLAMSGADVHAMNCYRQKAIVLTENETLLKIIRAVDKQSDELFVAGG